MTRHPSDRGLSNKIGAFAAKVSGCRAIGHQRKPALFALTTHAGSSARGAGIAPPPVIVLLIAFAGATEPF